jgi:hypothetical protein
MIIKDGGEGVILRRMRSLYKNGRSADLIKFKVQTGKKKRGNKEEKKEGKKRGKKKREKKTGKKKEEKKRGKKRGKQEVKNKEK